MIVKNLHLKQFTAFDDLELTLAPGLNVFIGENGTGKTHIMKVMYAACAVSKTGKNFAEKIVSVFLPSNRELGRLVKRKVGRSSCHITVRRPEAELSASFSNVVRGIERARIEGAKGWSERAIQAVYIPVKEMLANAPGFGALYREREIHFEEVYADIIDHASKPGLRGPVGGKRQELLKIIKKVIDGDVFFDEKEFFLRSRQGNLEFTLLAEGMRKLGLLLRLIQNGTLLNGAVLFWDEPETNLNPLLIRKLMEIVLELQREGVQIFLATHNYFVLREIDMMRLPTDKVLFHALGRDRNGRISCNSEQNYSSLHPNAIADAFDRLYDEEIKKAIGGLK
jgi:energy-coupling factor transporter ATP-binding protein EcfA2